MRNLFETSVENRVLGLLDEPRVSVLTYNLALDGASFGLSQKQRRRAPILSDIGDQRSRSAVALRRKACRGEVSDHIETRDAKTGVADR